VSTTLSNSDIIIHLLYLAQILQRVTPNRLILSTNAQFTNMVGHDHLCCCDHFRCCRFPIIWRGKRFKDHGRPGLQGHRPVP